MTSAPLPDVPGFRPGAVVVLVGPPGAGKSTYAARWPRSWVLNLDTYREMVADDPHDQSATYNAVRVERLILAARLGRGLSCVVDSTNVEERVRADLLAVVRPYRVPVIAVMFDVPLAVCLRRNAARRRPVPVDAVMRRHAEMPASRSVLLGEGFAGVHVLACGGDATP